LWNKKYLLKSTSTRVILPYVIYWCLFIQCSWTLELIANWNFNLFSPHDLVMDTPVLANW